MKKRSFSLACLLIISLVGLAQNTQLVYDFNAGRFVNNDYCKDGKPLPLRSGAFVVLKIINVNTFRWKVEMDGRSVNYVTQIPSELQVIFRQPDPASNTKKTEESLGEIGKDVAAMKGIALEVKLANQQDPNPSPVAKELEKSMKSLVEACDEYLLLSQKMANIKFRKVELIGIAKQKWASHKKLEEKLPTPFSVVQMKDDYNAFISFYAKAEAAYQKALNAVKLQQTEKENNTKLASPPANATTDFQKATAQSKAIEEASEGVEAAHAALSENNFLRLIEEVMILQDALANKAYFEVCSAPIQMNGDAVEFEVKTTPVQTSDLMPFEPAKSFPVEVPVKDGLKVDFSVGPTFSFGNNARDEKYYTEPIPGKDSVILLQRDNNNAINPGIAAMMHFYKRSGKSIAFGGMFGIGAGFQSLNDAKLSFYLGASLVLGKQEKIMISTGASYLNVAMLKNKQYVPNNHYATSDMDLGNITEKVFKPSFFISISYNLTNRVEIK